jgi:hypothetical protein
MAGVTFYVFSIINHYGFDGANDLSNNIFHLIVMLGFAGVGLLVYKELPVLFIFFAKASLQRHLHDIEDKLNKISETWGSEIITDNSPQPDKPEKGNKADKTAKQPAK